MKPATEASPGARKVAVLMAALGLEASSKLLKQLEPDEIRMVSAALNALGPVPVDEAHQVLQEFEEKASTRQIMGHGGPGYTMKLLSGTFGEEFARQTGLELSGEEVKKTALDLLAEADSEQLARILEPEHPQTVALLMSAMAPDAGSKIVSSFTPERQYEVFTRMAVIDQSDPAMIELIAESLLQRLPAGGAPQKQRASGVQLAAELINRLDPEDGVRVLDSVGSQAPELAESIRRLLFVFDDILKLDAKAMRELISRVDRKLLVLGLKGTSEEIRQKFLGSMSKNGASMLLEDIDAAGPVRLREVEGAQQQIISVVRQMEAEGLIDLRSAGAEEYVV